MPQIRILPERVANQIAAGEVVERPAAAVKELVENALDAGATRIDVEFRHGGRSLIRVDDNGRGMDRDDSRLAFERHATSKIADAADLDRLATFGFRGEALPSIASVSRCTLQTRSADSEAGTEILINAGRFGHIRDCGRPRGTRVDIEHLFQPVPARRKFLKTDRTEGAHIAHCVRLYALACPGVAFSLVEDGRVVFRSPECPTLADRVSEIFGRQLGDALIPVSASEAGLRLSGLVGRPGVGRTTRHETITFVNTRPVDSRALNFAILESFRESLQPGRYPPAFLFLECDPAAVDVNVHPAKREVRFRDEPAVRSFMVRSLVRCLQDLPQPLEASLGARPDAPPAAGATAVPFQVREDPQSPAPRAGPAPEARPAPAAGPGAPAWRFLGFAHESYAVFETPAGLVLLDRRAALERVWYERLLAQFAGSGVQSQRLLLPAPLELDPVSAALLVEQLDFLRAHGLELAEFGRHFFRIEAVPDWIGPSDAEAFVRDILGALREGRLGRADPTVVREQFARLAAARAARLPAHAGEPELRSLAAELFATRAPLTSPSGRPTFVELDRAELSRRFGR